MGAWTILDSPYFSTYVELALLTYNSRDLKRIFREFDNWLKGRPLNFEPKCRTVFKYHARFPKRNRNKKPKPTFPYRPLVDFDKLFLPPPDRVGVRIQPPEGSVGVFGNIYVLDVLPYDQWPVTLTYRRKGASKKKHRSSKYDREHPWWTTWKPPARKKKNARRRKSPAKATERERPNKVSDSELAASLRAFYTSKAAERVRLRNKTPRLAGQVPIVAKSAPKSERR